MPQPWAFGVGVARIAPLRARMNQPRAASTRNIMRHYDCAVIGTGPAGQKAAIQAAKLGKRVAIIEKSSAVGGAAINTGTIPSKALREAVMHLTGANKRGLFGEHYRVKRDITVADLIYVSQQVIHHELQ